MPNNNLLEHTDTNQSGKSLYVVLPDSAAKWWNGTTVETYADAHFATYGVPFAEQGTSGHFVLTTPTGLPVNNYSPAVRVKSGGSYAPSDATLGSISLYWDGTVWSVDARLDAAVSGIPASVWSSATRTLSAFGFSLSATCSGFGSGVLAQVAAAVWGALLSGMTTTGSVGAKLAAWVLGSDGKALLSSDSQASAVVTIDLTTPVPIRNQDAVTAPTVGDCLAGAWTEPFAKEPTESDPTQWVKQKPDNSGPVRTLTLTLDSNGNPIGRE